MQGTFVPLATMLFRVGVTTRRGQLGTSDQQGGELPREPEPIQIEVGRDFSCALGAPEEAGEEGGSVLCWGENSWGHWGMEASEATMQSAIFIPTPLLVASRVKGISFR